MELIFSSSGLRHIRISHMRSEDEKKDQESWHELAFYADVNGTEKAFRCYLLFIGEKKLIVFSNCKGQTKRIYSEFALDYQDLMDDE